MSCARRLIEMEPHVNEVLETRWPEIDVKGLGFVCYSNVVELQEKLPGDSNLASVIEHIRARFAEIAFSSGDDLVLTPAAAHKSIVNVKRRYRRWL
jgi:hypothetical protein